MATYAETLRELQALLDAKDRRIAELEAALEAHVVSDYVEGKPPVRHTSNCGYWTGGACFYSCKVTLAALKRETPA